jgi:hypothetical protein
METSSKTAGKIKAYVDQVADMEKELEKEVKDLVQTSKIRYHQQLEKIKERASEAKGEVTEMHKAQCQKAKESFEEITRDARDFMETRMEPLSQKILSLREKVMSYSDITEEKLQEIKKETEELLQTTKLAVHNFKETFRSHQES